MINFIDNNNKYNGAIMTMNKKKYWSYLFKGGAGVFAIFGIFSMIQDLKQQKYNGDNDSQVIDRHIYPIEPNVYIQHHPFKATLLTSKKDIEKARQLVPENTFEGRDECIKGNFFADRRTEEQPNNIFCRSTEGVIVKNIN